MKLTILNGSPKGEVSNTMQYYNLVEKRFPDHSYTLFNIGLDIGRIEEEPSHFEQTVESIALSNGVRLSLYTLNCRGDTIRQSV